MPYVRWFIHPLRDRASLPKLMSDNLKEGQFLGMLTESRSLVVLDRRSGDYWSIKVSLPKGVGAFTDKSYTSHEAAVHFQNSEYLLEQQKDGRVQETKYLPEIESRDLKNHLFPISVVILILISTPHIPLRARGTLNSLAPTKKVISISTSV